MKPKVTVIVLSYNHGEYVLETLESVRAQTYKETELIIVDDHSADDSVAVIDHWLQTNHVECSFIRHIKNQGICKSLNDALAAATGKYISMVASDDVWLPDKINQQVELFEGQPDSVGVVYSDAYQINEQGTLSPMMFIATHRGKLLEIPQGQILDSLLGGNFIPAMATLVRRSCYDEVGLYDESLPWEDWDMWMRIARRYTFVYSPEPSAKYRIHGKSYSHSHRARMVEGALHVAVKQSRLALSEAQKALMVKTMRLCAMELYRLTGADATASLRTVWQATNNKTVRSMYRFARLGFSYNSWGYVRRSRDRIADRLRSDVWYPLLILTKPLRNVLNLRR